MQITAELDAPSAIRFSQVCCLVRQLFVEHQPLVRICRRLFARDEPTTSANYAAISTIARRPSIIATPTLLAVLTRAPRNFLIDQFEWPHMKDEAWRQPYRGRFTQNAYCLLDPSMEGADSNHRGNLLRWGFLHNANALDAKTHDCRLLTVYDRFFEVGNLQRTSYA